MELAAVGDAVPAAVDVSSAEAEVDSSSAVDSVDVSPSESEADSSSVAGSVDVSSSESEDDSSPVADSVSSSEAEDASSDEPGSAAVEQMTSSEISTPALEGESQDQLPPESPCPSRTGTYVAQMPRANSSVSVRDTDQHREAGEDW